MATDADEKARIEAEKWAAEKERRQREEAERQRAQGVRESVDQLNMIIGEWPASKRIEQFLQEVESCLSSLLPEDRPAIIDRLNSARALLVGTDPLERFLTLKAPGEE